MAELRWNDIPGLTLQEQEWMDNLAHGGPVTPEMVEWVTKLLIDRSYAVYANHLAIQKRVAMTFKSWKREG